MSTLIAFAYNARSVMCFTHREPMLRYYPPPGGSGPLREGPMSAPKLAFFLGITLVALLTFTKGVPRHQNTATATTAPAIFQKMMPVAY
jgi:hypothetical protein